MAPGMKSNVANPSVHVQHPLRLDGCYQLLDCPAGETRTLFLDLADASTRMALDNVGLVMIHSPNARGGRTFLAGPVVLIR